MSMRTTFTAASIVAIALGGASETMPTEVQSAAAFNIFAASSQVAGVDESRIYEYNAPCTAVGQCCAPMECYNGGDPHHCLTVCWTEEYCRRYEDFYGELTCVRSPPDYVWPGFCK